MDATSTESPRIVFQHEQSYAPTPLLDLPELAKRCGVSRVYVKDESRRPLGSFKSLGGMFAGLRALARASGSPSIEAFLAGSRSTKRLPALICASDGNHGLAVAAAAEIAGGASRIYLPRHVPQSRAKRIADRGAEIVWVEGTYDDAVDAALTASQRGEGLLVTDTSARIDDPVVVDVMTGYGLMADELAEQFPQNDKEAPTHLFVQAGVGGLAAALARGLQEKHALSTKVIVVEPERCDCVGQALRANRIERLTGDLQTSAEMLSCGEASAPAVAILRRIRADAIVVSERGLAEAVEILEAYGGLVTTPSGATGLAGLLTARPGTSLAKALHVNECSRVLLIVTEGPVPRA